MLFSEIRCLNEHFHPWHSPYKRIHVPDINNNVYAQQQAATCPCLHIALSQSTPLQCFTGCANRDCSPSPHRQRARQAPFAKQTTPTAFCKAKIFSFPPHGKLSIKQAVALECGQDCRQENLGSFEECLGNCAGQRCPEAEAASRAGETLPALTHRHSFVRTQGLGGLGRSPDRVPALHNFRGTMKSLSRVLLPTPVTSWSVTMEMLVMLQRKALTSPGEQKGAVG